jgi:pimeloyl-ACP methyl ester carboxylesterase
MSRLIKVAAWSGEKRSNVVFVHGLGGHPYDTWRGMPDNGTFWPLWLAEDVKGLSVYSLGYILPPTDWLGTAMPLLDEAAHALRVLLNSEELRTGLITFVCHSLGGLMVKSMIRSANEQKGDPAIADFYARVRQVVFIATPHTGSGKATLLEWIGWLTWPSASSRNLVANNPELRDLNFGYRTLTESRDGQCAHLVYYEMVDTLFGRIVSPASADPGLPNCKPTPIRKDHITIAKPERRDELVYAETKNLVSKLAPEPTVTGQLRKYTLEPFNTEWSFDASQKFIMRTSYERMPWRRKKRNAPPRPRGRSSDAKFLFDPGTDLARRARQRRADVSR